MSIDLQATERVMKARVELTVARKFYGVLVSNVEPVLSRAFPTMATNGRQHFFNPDFIMGLSKNHLGQEVPPALLVLGVQAHESEHDARRHGTRRNGRDPDKWNEAGDYAINIDLIDEGFHLPWGALIDEKYRGMSAEDIYRSRELDEQKEQPQPQGDDSRDDNQDDNQDDNRGGQQDEQPDEDDHPQEQDAQPQDADNQDDNQDDQQDGGGSEAESEAGEAEAEPSAEGEGGAEPSAEGGEGEPQPGQAPGGDPGMCGQVLDSVTDGPADAAEEDIRWERITRQAASMAKAVGELPGHVAREIERANNPPRDWRDELREFCEEGALRIETWNRPNRRFAHSGLILPGTQRDGINKAVFIIDTSGSMDAVALACVNDEAQVLLDDGIIDEVVVLYGDTRLTREDHYKTGDQIEFDPLGGGGTDMAPLFEHVAEQHDDASLIVNFTDLMFYRDCGPEPHCPVLFAVHGYPEHVPNLIANAPWGARGIDVGVH